jgi:hypothetical protein
VSKPKDRKSEPTVRQSQVRADNARVVLGWAKDPRTESVFLVYPITVGEADANRSKGRPGPTPFDRASALEDEIERHSTTGGPPIPSEIWRAYRIEEACDARLVRAFVDSLFKSLDRVDRKKDLDAFDRALIKGESPGEIEARLWRLDPEVKVPFGDPLRVPGSPAGFASLLTNRLRRTVMRVEENWGSLISQRQKESEKRIGRPPEYEVPEDVREFILTQVEKGTPRREIVQDVNGWSRFKISQAVVSRVRKDGRMKV